jgi:hypothetical protein
MGPKIMRWNSASKRFSLLFCAPLVLIIAGVHLGSKQDVTCIYADSSSDPGQARINGGKCQKCGNDGEWFDVPSTNCPACQAKGDKKLNTVEGQPLATSLRAPVTPQSAYCIDGNGKRYSKGALLFTDKCVRCDTHLVFSDDNPANCQECKK